MISNLLYLLGESLRGWIRHRRILFPTLVTVLLGALLLEGAVATLLVVHRFSPVPDDSWKVDLFLREGVSSGEPLEELQRAVSAVPGILRWNVVTKEQAAERFRSDFGGDALDLVGGQVLPVSIEVWPQEEWKTLFRYRPWLRMLEDIPGVELASSSVDALEWISERKGEAEAVVGTVVVLLLIALYIILGNVVRMSLLARSLLIENMVYIGASETFIVLPFLFETVLLGVVSGGIAWALGEGLLWVARSGVPGWAEWFAPLGWMGAATPALLALLGVWTTLRTMRTVLRKGLGG